MREMLTETTIEDSPVNNLLGKLKDGPKVWGQVSQEINAVLNTVPKYIRSGSESFQKDREMLNTRPGMVIANHPSSLDIFFVFPAITRPDALIMMQRKRFPYLQKTFGADHVVPAPANNTEFEALIDRVIRHIVGGGLFILFPSGGEEMKTNEMQFKSGFRHFLPRLSPENMVYSFFIDPNAGKTIMDEMIGPPANASDRPILIAPELHVRPRTERLDVKVNESFSEASEWQEIMNHSDNSTLSKKDSALTRHFLEKTAF